MRTGSVGNRSAEDMVKTLIPEKKLVISSIREKLLSRGYSEEVEYDSINIEPVLLYSKPGGCRLFVKHKWELVLLLLIDSERELKEIQERHTSIAPENLGRNEEDGTLSIKFSLPEEEEIVMSIIDCK